MKKSFLLVIALLAFNVLFANPVDVNRAMELGQKFVAANFVQNSSSLELVYTENSELGEPCFYIFNVSDHGFVMVSADDCAHPILGYSEESIFDVNNIAPGMSDVMYSHRRTISYAKENKATATPKIAAEWKSLEVSGKTKLSTREQGVGPLLTTKWNQSWPYNKFCPEQPASWASHGHAVVGCVATAMAQVMAYWDYPAQGTGSHTYTPKCTYCGANPSYPPQTANFGATTYDWANMVDEIDASSPVEQIDAIATISYHCGVSVDMMYDHCGNGSGAYSDYVPDAIRNYFGYAQSTYMQRDITPEWDALLLESLDRGVPIYYSGFDESVPAGGHAFVCDGYDENGLFHFNFGWGGASDGYFTTETMEYHVGSVAVFNFVPAEVFNNTAQAPTALNVTPAANNELSATLTWTNPSKSLGNSTLSSIDKIVVERDGLVIAELTDVTPGQAVTFVDEDVPSFSYFTYSVYAVVDGVHGSIERAEKVQFGPTCDWTLILQSSAFQGMRGASVSIYDAAGVEFESKTTTNSTTTTFDIALPLNKVQFAWNPPTQNNANAFNMTIIVKDPNGATVYSKTSSSDEMASGVFLTVNNTCGESLLDCEVPTNLNSTAEDDNVVLTWDAAGNPFYGYNIYRDGLLIALSKETTFVDENVPHGGHCYTVSAMCENGNTERSNEVCNVVTEGCDPAFGLWYEYTSSNKIKIYWETPTNSEGLSGYNIMRKTSEETEWKRVKVLGANKNDYTDNTATAEDLWYAYKVIAYYQDIDCMSAPAKSKYGNQYFINICSPNSVESQSAQQVGVYPNPADEKVTIEATGINNVTVFNLMGQKVYESSVDGDMVELNTSNFDSGIYMIQVTTSEYTTTKRISIAH